MAKERKGERKQRQRRSKWPARLLLAFVGTGIIFWFAPWIVARTALRDRILPLALPQFEGQGTIGAAKLDWLSPIDIQELSLRDRDGQALLDCARVHSDRTLSQLVFGGIGGTTFRLDEPHVYCQIREGGSNIEDALEPLLSEDTSSGDALAYTIEVTGGTVELSDETGELQSVISQIEITCAQQPGSDPPLDLTASAVITDADKRVDGKLSLDTQLAAAEDGSWDAGAGNATLKIDGLALQSLQILLHRFVPAGEIAGMVNADYQVAWDVRRESPDVKVTGRLDGKDCAVAGLAFLQQDRLWLTGLQSNTQFHLTGDRLNIEQCHVDSELAQLDVTGIVHTDGLQDLEPAAIFGDDDYQVRGRVNLAKLADRMPDVLNLRDEVRVTSGDLTLSLDSTVEETTRKWHAQVTASQLEGTAGGRPLSWKRPIEITLDAHQTQTGNVAGQLKCDSEFLQIAADGSVENATISARGDLDRLAADLAQWIDWGGIRLAGRFDVGVALARENNGNFDANGHALLQEFEFSVPGLRPWRESRMTIAAEAAGTASVTEIRQLQHASFRVVSVGDRLDVTLRRPVDDPTQTGSWPLDLALTGQLATWLPRFGPWLPLKDWQLNGGIRVTAKAEVSRERANIEEAKMQLVQFRGRGPGVTFDEPQVDIETSGNWDANAAKLTSALTTIASQTVGLRAEQVEIALPPTGSDQELRLSGDVAVAGNVARLHALFTDPQRTAEQRLDGRLEGSVRLASNDGVTSGDWSATIHDLVVSQPSDSRNNRNVASRAPARGSLQTVGSTSWQQVWTEKRMTLGGSGTYQRDEDSLQLQDVSIQSGILQLQKTAGTIDRLSTVPAADLAGEVRYDLATLTTVLRPYLGDGVRLTGQGVRSFRYQGPLSAPAENAVGQSTPLWSGATAEAALGWTGLELYGMSGGAGELHATLVDGLVRFEPLDIPLNEGAVRTTPEIRLNAQPAALVFSRGPTIDRARITPQLCRSWFQYITPVLAGAVEAEGQFSVDLQQATVPLASPRDCDVAGTLSIHTAQVRPGALASQLIGIARQVEALVRRQPTAGALGGDSSTTLNIKPHDVAFAVADGRVHHKGFQIEVGDVLVQTSGYVAMDNTLSMVAEVPIRDSWVQSDRLLQGLRGQTLQIPITGTLDKPKLDKRALSQIARQMATGAASGLIDDALNKGLNEGLQKGLEGLFKSRP